MIVIILTYLTIPYFLSPGDFMGPTIDSIDHLIRMPAGCGEQNMIHFAPNVYIYNYLNETSRLTPEQKMRLDNYTFKGK